MANSAQDYVRALQSRYARDIRAKVGPIPSSNVPGISGYGNAGLSDLDLNSLYEAFTAPKPKVPTGTLRQMPGGSNVDRGVASGMDKFFQTQDAIARRFLGNDIGGWLRPGTRTKNLLETPTAGNIIDTVSIPLYATRGYLADIASSVGGLAGRNANEFERAASKRWRDDPVNEALSLFGVNLSGKPGAHSNMGDVLPGYMKGESKTPWELSQQGMRNDHLTTSDVIDRITGRRPDSDAPLHLPGGREISYQDLRSGLGLAGDILTDPINIVPGGVASKALRVGRLTSAGRGPAGASAREIAAREAIRSAENPESVIRQMQKGEFKLEDGPGRVDRLMDFARRYGVNWKNTRSGFKSDNATAARSGGMVDDYSRVPVSRTAGSTPAPAGLAREVVPPPSEAPALEAGRAASTAPERVGAPEITQEQLLEFSTSPEFVKPNKPVTNVEDAAKLAEGDTLGSKVEKIDTSANTPQLREAVADRLSTPERMPFTTAEVRNSSRILEPEFQRLIDDLTADGPHVVFNGKSSVRATPERLREFLMQDNAKPGTYARAFQDEATAAIKAPGEMPETATVNIRDLGDVNISAETYRSLKDATDIPEGAKVSAKQAETMMEDAFEEHFPDAFLSNDSLSIIYRKMQDAFEGSDAFAEIPNFYGTIEEVTQTVSKFDKKSPEWKKFSKYISQQIARKHITRVEGARLRAAETPEDYQKILEEIRNSEYTPLDAQALESVEPLSPEATQEVIEDASKTVSEKDIDRLVNPPLESDGVLDLNSVARQSLSTVIRSKSLKSVVDETHPHRTDVTGANTNAAEAYTGQAIHRTTFNAPKQVQLAAEIIKPIRRRAQELHPIPNINNINKLGRAERSEAWGRINSARAAQDKFVAERVPAVLREAEKMFQDHGGAMIIGNGTSGPQMYMSQVVDIIGSDPRLAQFLYDTRTNVNLGNVLLAAEEIIKNPGLAGDELISRISEALTAKIPNKSASGQTLYNNILAPRGNYAGQMASRLKLPRELKGQALKEAIGAHSVARLAQGLADNAEIIRELAKNNASQYLVRTKSQSIQMTDDFIETLVKNLDDPNVSITDAVDTLVNREFKVKQAADDLGANTQALKESIRDTQDALPDIVSPEAAQTADNIVTNVKAAEKDIIEGGSNNTNVARQKQAAEDFAAIEKRLVESDPELATDFAELQVQSIEELAIQRFMRGGLAAKFMNAMGKGFRFGRGAEAIPGLADKIGAAQNSVRAMHEAQVRDIYRLGHVHTRSVMQEAFSHLRSGRPLGTINDPAVRAAANDLVPHIQMFFDVTNDAGFLRGAFGHFGFQNGIPIDAINAEAGRRGLHYIKFDVDGALEKGIPDETRAQIRRSAEQKINAQKAKDGSPKFKEGSKSWERAIEKEFNAEITKAIEQAKAGNNPAMIGNQWRTWDFPEDPIDAITDLSAVYQTVIVNSTVADMMVTQAKQLKAFSTRPVHGWLRIKKNPDDALSHFLQDGWYHPEFVDTLRAMERTLTDMSGQIPKFLEVISPLIDLWKAGMTVWRPGHHGRNILGDIALTHAATGTMNPRDIINAFRVAKNSKLFSEGFDFQQMVQALKDPDKFIKANKGTETYLDRLRFLTGQRQLLEATDASTPIMNITLKNGQKVSLNGEQIYSSAAQRGSMPDTVTREGLLSETFLEGGSPKAFKKSEEIRIKLGKLGGKGRGRELVSRFSQDRDHIFRLHHYNAYIRKNAKRFNSVEELLDAAAYDVRKWHPDGTGFTRFEQTVMRHAFPFYMWTRKALPMVMESMFFTPSRAMIYPKAMYAWAESQGIDLHSLGDPFPEDQLFPSFLREGIVGTSYRDAHGNYRMLSLGNPTQDLMSQFLPGTPREGIINYGPARGVAGMLNPIPKGIIELATGQNINTGVPITDYSDYFDSQIPGANWINSLLGISPTSFAGGDTLFGNDFSPVNRQVARGNRPQIDPYRLASFLTGASSLNQSQENYINIAEMEARDRAGR